MQETLKRYRDAIRAGRVQPLVHWDGQTTGLIFDADRDDVPLTRLGFGACRLSEHPHVIETAEREYAFVPLEAAFEIRVGGELYTGRREGGPFATLPGRSNAWAVYAPRDCRVALAGRGEMIYYSAPAVGRKPPAVVRPGDRENVVRGSGVWRREVVTLFTPEDVTTILIGGETYSPPGLWSGTPLHIHDVNDPDRGQSDHEEVYFHLARINGGRWGPFGVQMLFDDQGLDQAYVVHDHDAFAIPGAAHPVIAGPSSDMLYVWALAGEGPGLRMDDVEEFAYLKRVGELLDRFAAGRPRQPIEKREFDDAVAEAGLTPEQAGVLRLHLAQQGIEVNRD